MSRKAELRAHVREHARDRPGVYRMLGPSGEVLYVGKSVRVRTRLLSYFRARRGEKAAEIVGHAHRIEWDYVPNEFAALLTELRQIKRWRPVYNVEHKRDRQYCFIKRTREAAPRLLLAGDVANDNALYFGPFRGRARVRDAIRELSDILELRDCRGSTPMRFADQLDLFGRDDPPGCYRGEIRRCLAPCAGRCTRSAYLERVDHACRFLEGSADEPLLALQERMHQAADRLQFEYAAELRDRATRLENVRKELLALRGTLQTLTHVYRVPGHDGDDRLYLIRRGLVCAEFSWPRTAEERSRVADAIRVALDGFDPAPLRVEPHQAAEILLVARWFRLHPAERDRLHDPATLLEPRRTA
ncbi:MAG TPA: UvrB/UvrC motif-containing protein [Longimicrobiales bacterium]